MGAAEVTLRMPGKFDEFFSGTSVGQGQLEDGDAGVALAATAYREATRVRVGSGYYLSIARREQGEMIYLEGTR
ncbi:hypothetical protein [Microbispora sp. NPDC049125]|uniref:hypothetical protein n=1 Tax=Microbispora sp. NPDC049125 TaxID=3154929 RepID=UPI0034667B20